MNILLINKFLYPKGGSETYIFKLGKMLRDNGHNVEYFGLENEKNIVGNKENLLVSEVDFSKGTMKNLFAPFRIIYSAEAKNKMARLLESFKPDVVHLNNIQFHLTPSIMIAVGDYRKKTGRNVKLVYTAHDYQLICASHGMFDTNLNPCEKCLGGNYTHCLRTKCVKNSYAKSFIGMLDAYLWKYNKAYSYIDKIICPSNFLKGKLDSQKRFAGKTVALHNFIDMKHTRYENKKGYVLEFGHLSKDKGTDTLLEAAKRMPDVKFVFAGYGESVEKIEKTSNAEYVGFKTGEELFRLIGEAAVTICPSEMYENCPFSVIESQLCGTPTIGAKMGGIPELINPGVTGELFTAGDVDELEEKLRLFTHNPEKLKQYTESCKYAKFETPDTYYEKLMRIYNDENI